MLKTGYLWIVVQRYLFILNHDLTPNSVCTKYVHRQTISQNFLDILKCYNDCIVLDEMLYMELTDLKKIICLRKSEESAERISVCNVSEKLMEHGNLCLPCFFTNDVKDLLP